MDTIKRYVQGNPQSDRELFGLLGPWVTWNKLHEELGMPITSETGDVWFVATLNKHHLAGFALARKLKSKPAAHIRFIYAADNPDKTIQALINDMEIWAKKEGIANLHTNDRETTDTWLKAGYIKNGNPRGSFIRYQKDLK